MSDSDSYVCRHDVLSINFANPISSWNNPEILSVIAKSLYNGRNHIKGGE
jgi:hypothetical protein